MYGWMDGRMDGWIDGWMGGKMDVCMHACMHVCMAVSINWGTPQNGWILMDTKKHSELSQSSEDHQMASCPACPPCHRRPSDLWRSNLLWLPSTV